MPYESVGRRRPPRRPVCGWREPTNDAAVDEGHGPWPGPAPCRIQRAPVRLQRSDDLGDALDFGGRQVPASGGRPHRPFGVRDQARRPVRFTWPEGLARALDARHQAWMIGSRGAVKFHARPGLFSPPVSRFHGWSARDGLSRLRVRRDR
jgi:hypothetical protein